MSREEFLPTLPASNSTPDDLLRFLAQGVRMSAEHAWRARYEDHDKGWLRDRLAYAQRLNGLAVEYRAAVGHALSAEDRIRYASFRERLEHNVHTLLEALAKPDSLKNVFLALQTELEARGADFECGDLWSFLIHVHARGSVQGLADQWELVCENDTEEPESAASLPFDTNTDEEDDDEGEAWKKGL
jgi:hypothetical protein